MFSIIIPCRNEARYIAKCLDSILSNGYPHHQLEIIVADGISSDGSDQIVKEYAEKFSCVKYLQNEMLFTPHGLNKGIEASSGEYVMILGAHAELTENYIQTCLDLFDEYPDAACVGGYVQHIAENKFSAAVAKAMSHPFGVGNAHFRTGRFEGFVDTVAFGAYRKCVFQLTGLFDESLVRNQDDEFSFRMKQHGLKILLSLRLRSLYYVRSALSKLARQYFQYGYWKVYVNRRHKAITTYRQLVPPVFVLAVIISIISIILMPSLLLPALILASLYLALSLFFAAGIAEGIEEFAIIPWVFPVLHFSYGWGYLRGLVDFLILQRKLSDSSKSLTR